MLKTLALALALLLAASTAPLRAQSRTAYREIKIHSCTRADSVLPAGSDALRGHVRAFYNTATDSTRLAAGNERGASVQAKIAGHGPAPAPVAQLTVLLGNLEAEVVKRGEQPPIVTLTTDDSVTQELSPIRIGTFVAIGGSRPPPSIVRIPLSAEVDAVNLKAIARARNAVLHVGADVTIEISDDDRRDIGALYVVMVCGM